MSEFIIKKVCVLGGGLMGRQIALNTAIHGYDVYIYDNFSQALESVKIWIEDYLDTRIAKGKMTKEQVGEIKQRFTICSELKTAADGADLIIEAIIEDIHIKEKLFIELNEIAREDTIIATNSSYMVSSMFAPFIKNPSRLANIHYFNPALVMRLTEVVSGEHTSPETVQALMDFSISSDKTPIWVKKEIDGFIANRIVRVIRSEAMWLYEHGYASYDDIDKAVELGLNHPMGPFRLLDLVGNDFAYHAAKNVYEKTGVKPAGFSLLEAKNEAGEHGKKTGKGWYEY